MKLPITSIRQRKHCAKTCAGFTLIEALIALVVIAALMAGILGVVKLTSGASKEYAMVQEVQTMISTIDRLYGPAAKTSGAPYLGIAPSVVLPYMGQYATNLPSIRTPFGTDVLILNAALYGTGGDSYQIRFRVPYSSCTVLVNDLKDTFPGLRAAGTTLVWPGSAAPTPAQIVTACTPPTGTSAEQTLTMYLYRA